MATTSKNQNVAKLDFFAFWQPVPASVSAAASIRKKDVFKIASLLVNVTVA